MSPLGLGLSTKLALIFGGLLLLSLAGNVYQARAGWTAYGEAKGEQKRQVLAAENAGLKQSAAVNAAIAKHKALDTTALLERLGAVAERGEQVRVVYRQAAARAPLDASCAPGQERIDAVDAGLGPTIGGKAR